MGSVWWSRLRTTTPRGSCHAERPQNAPYQWSYHASRIQCSSARRRRLAELGHCARPERRSPGSVARRTNAACHPGTSAGISRDSRTCLGLDRFIQPAGWRCSGVPSRYQQRRRHALGDAQDESPQSRLCFTVLIPASAGERPSADDVSSGDELAPCTLLRPCLRPR